MGEVPPFREDGCDRCGPFVLATHIAFKDDTSMTLCTHHKNQHTDGLVADGFDVMVLPVVRAAVVTPGG